MLSRILNSGRINFTTVATFRAAREFEPNGRCHCIGNAAEWLPLSLCRLLARIRSFNLSAPVEPVHANVPRHDMLLVSFGARAAQWSCSSAILFV